MADPDPTKIRKKSHLRIDLQGKVFGELTVLGVSIPEKTPLEWLCRCSCGKEKVVGGQKLRIGHTKSCGCKTSQWRSEHNIEHGSCRSKRTKEYTAWISIKARCLNPKINEFKRYGAREITICDEWRYSFPQFLADMGNKPSPSHSVDRIDNSLGYSASNCRWATNMEQARNTRKTVFIDYDGKRKPLREWAEQIGIKSATLWTRLFHYGWTVEEAMTSAVRKSSRWLQSPSSSVSESPKIPACNSPRSLTPSASATDPTPHSPAP